MAFSVPIFLLVVIGVFLLAPWVKQKGRISVAKSVRASKRARIVTEKTSPLSRYRESILLSIEQAGIKLSWHGYLATCFVASLLGAGFGALVNNMPLSLVLATLSPLVVTQYIKLRSLSYRAYVYMQVEDSLSIITQSYRQSVNICVAIESCLEHIEAPLKNILSDCVHEIYLGVPATDAILCMRARIDNPSWREWCDMVIRCQNDRRSMSLLLPIVQKIASVRQAQIEQDAKVTKLWRDHILICLIAVGAVPFIRLLNTDWYALLTGTMWGKMAIAIAYGIAGIATLYVARINKPISMEV